MDRFNNKGQYKDEITCPYCGYEFGDSWEYSDSDTIDCEECGKKFTYERNYNVDYSSQADCKLNGEEHELYEVVGVVKYLFCKKCDQLKLIRKSEASHG